MNNKSTEEFEKCILERSLSDLHEFQNYQKLVLDSLSFFSNLCRDNNIDYYLAYGSLLGAIRDGGQIPWDYDVDVWVKIDDKDRLLEALKRSQSSDFYYDTRLINKKCRHYILRICPVNHNIDVIHLDIFWLFGANEKKKKRLEKKRKKVRTIMRHKFSRIDYVDDGIWPKFRHIASKIIYFFYPTFLCDNFMKSIMKKSCCDVEYLAEDYESIFKREWFDSTMKIKFPNGEEYSVPCGYNDILNTIYGNYMNKPQFEITYREYNDSLKKIRKIDKIK